MLNFGSFISLNCVAEVAEVQTSTNATKRRMERAAGATINPDRLPYSGKIIDALVNKMYLQNLNEEHFRATYMLLQDSDKSTAWQADFTQLCLLYCDWTNTV